MRASRRAVLRFRFVRHELHRPPDSAGGPEGGPDVALLDYGVQDTGPDGSGWALANRGWPGTPEGLALAWTIRGAPHAYRRSDLAAVALATAPLSEADAGKRIFDAATPLRAAGIAPLEALAVVAGHLRDIVTGPTVKGAVSRRLTEVLEEPYLRSCRPCDATHAYEMPFRLAALQAGLELEPGTSPPVLTRIPGLRPLRYRRPGGEAEARFDVVRNHVRFYGPARPRDAATFLDAPLRDVRAHWPDDVVEVAVEALPAERAEPRFLLAEDLGALAAAEADRGERCIRLLGPFDPYLQLRDRELLVADEAHRKDLWRTLGRPGAVVADGEILGTWRPRASGRRFGLRLAPWQRISPGDRALVEREAERLSAWRDARFDGITED